MLKSWNFFAKKIQLIELWQYFCVGNVSDTKKDCKEYESDN